MTYTDRRIVKTYFGLFEGLNPISKLELIELLSKSLKTEWTTKENDFYKSFGAFASDKTPEEIVANIKSSRRFRRNEKNENKYTEIYCIYDTIEHSCVCRGTEI